MPYPLAGRALKFERVKRGELCRYLSKVDVWYVDLHSARLSAVVSACRNPLLLDKARPLNEFKPEPGDVIFIAFRWYRGYRNGLLKGVYLSVPEGDDVDTSDVEVEVVEPERKPEPEEGGEGQDTGEGREEIDLSDVEAEVVGDE